MSIFKILDIDETSLELANITTDKIYDNSKQFHDEGLFSQVIFGPVKDYTCKCGITKYKGTCPKCGVKYLPSSIRRRLYAKIELPVDILHPIAYIYLTLNNKVKSVYYNYVLNGKGYNPYTGEFESDIKLTIDDNLLYGLDALERYIIDIVESGNKNKTVNMLYRLIQFGLFRTRNVVVIPPEFRPVNKEYMAEINKFYVSYLLVVNKPSYGHEIFRQLSLLKIQKKHIDYIIDRLSSKSGIFRSRIAGKRIDVSGRSVIIPARIPHDYVEVPRLMLMKMYMTEVGREYAKLKGITFKQAFEELLDFYEKSIVPLEVEKIVDEIVKDKIVLINRQPTLHRGSILPAKIKPSNSFAIGLPHLIVDPLNADYDGDQLAIYDTYHKEEAERLLKLAPISAANGELQFTPKQDVIYTVYKVSKLPDDNPIKKELETLLGIKIHKPIGKKELINILKEKYEYDKDILDGILSFTERHIQRTTLALNDFRVDFDYQLDDDYEENMKLIKQAEEDLKTKFPKADIIKSGARATFQQIRQITFARGYVSDFFGNIVDYPIKHGYIDGLTEDEFFYSAYGTRKSLLDTAFIVGDSGYLTRRLVYMSTNAVIDSDDCNTKHTFKIYVKDYDMAKRLKYRYYYLEDPRLNKDTTLHYVDDPHEIVGKTIYLRSPIYCESEGICKTCYGKLYDIHQSRYVGFIAAQTLGERSTQLTLRTFHTGGVAEKKSESSDKKQEDITTALKQVENIIDKTIKLNSHDDIYNMVMRLYEIFKDYSSMHLVHIETIISQSIYVIQDKSIPYKQYKYKDDFTHVKKVASKLIPMLVSPMLSIFFERPRTSIIKALEEENEKLSVLERTLLNLEDGQG